MRWAVEGSAMTVGWKSPQTRCPQPTWWLEEKERGMKNSRKKFKTSDYCGVAERDLMDERAPTMIAVIEKASKIIYPIFRAIQLRLKSSSRISRSSSCLTSSISPTRARDSSNPTIIRFTTRHGNSRRKRYNHNPGTMCLARNSELQNKSYDENEKNNQNATNTCIFAFASLNFILV